MGGACMQGYGDNLSEPALWTQWENRGDLVAASDSTLLTLAVDKFISVVIAHKRALGAAVDRSRLIIQWLNQFNASELTDIVPDYLPGHGGRSGTSSASTGHLASLRKSYRGGAA